MIHRSQTGRHDLLQCRRIMPEAPLDLVAQFCGYTRREEHLVEAAPLPSVEVRPAPLREAQPPASSRIELLCPVQAASRDPGKSIVQDQPRLQCEILLNEGNEITDRELSSHEVPLPAKPPLQPWARLWPFVRRALGRLRESRRLDIRPLLGLLAEHRPITRLPCLRYPGWSEQVQVIFDRRPDLLPFWDDMEAVLHRIRQQHGGEGLKVVPLDDGRPPAALARPGQPVLVLSDLGCLAGDPQIIQAWRACGQRLRRAGLRHAALLPCPRDRWDNDLAQIWACACWDRGQPPPQGRRGLQPLPQATEAERAVRVKGLLTLLAPALRVEPGLLRAIRLLLPPGQADVGAEYDAWHHAQAVFDASAMGLRAAHAVAWREEHRRSVTLAAKAALLRLLRLWHEGCAETIRSAEILYLNEAGAPVPDEEVKKARTTQNRAAAALLKRAREGDQPAAIAEGHSCWQRRELARSSPTARAAEEFLAVGWVIFRWWSGEGAAQVPDDLNPEVTAEVQRLLQEDPGRETLWELRQVGAELLIRPWEPSLALAGSASSNHPLTPSLSPSGGEGARRAGAGAALITGAPLAWLRSRRAQINLEIENASGQKTHYNFISRRAQSLRHWVGCPQRLMVSSDCAELELLPLPHPAWAKRFGQDQFGLLAELDLDGVLFPLRWIPPGSFLMGSPGDEKGRFSDEVQHRVTLTGGYWLATTPCTQEQWQAVTGENPSQFQKPYDPKRPVESVSWEDCRQFCTRLHERVPDLDFCLPTEAQCEYACRAGTASAFNDGSDCTKPEGKDPALERLGWHGEGGEGQTHPVGEKKPNAWGLHDMHGNVWEWCVDQAEWTGSDIVTDTYVDGAVDPICEKGAGRVVRGGSSWGQARLCRSASRLAGVPDLRGWYQGFRLAAGQPPGRGAPSLAAGGAVAPGPGAPAVRPARSARRPVHDRKSEDGRSSDQT